MIEFNKYYFLKIKTSVKFYDAIFERVYKIKIVENNKFENFLYIDLITYDKSPAGKKLSKTEKALLIKNKVSREAVIPYKKTKHLIAKIALENDSSLDSKSYSEYERRSKKYIKDFLLNLEKGIKNE